jgi:phosphoenolpyruvate synthase/pyruvate phosphate dikinase
VEAPYKAKNAEGYYEYAADLEEKLLHGSFPKDIQEQFINMLEYFGQSPIIVRSSSLLEDNFGNAFAGKYESVFCVNQGTPQERYEAFEQAVRTVYASTMNEEALNYRMNRDWHIRMSKWPYWCSVYQGPAWDYFSRILQGWGIPPTFMFGMKVLT